MASNTKKIDAQGLYRLPWNVADNAITWLEPTTKCNMYCEGCYRINDPEGHRPLEEVIADLQNLRKLRRSDGISIAGGEPLLYPHIVPLVKWVASNGWKPIIITNGTLLTEEIIRDLTKAGLIGFTIHVDSHQFRPGWQGKNEEELCELRLELAQMIHRASKGKVACSFNATIYPDTLKDIPYLTKWAQDHIDLVHTLVFILFRLIKVDPRFDYFVKGRKINPDDADNLRYEVDHSASFSEVMADDVVDKIKEVSPGYEPAAYLNSTQEGNQVKWLLALRTGTKDEELVYMDGKLIEMGQVLHHLFFDTYLAYMRPVAMKFLHILFPLAVINRGLRKLLKMWITNPSLWKKQLYMQTILVLQPPDILEDGKQAMCDGCPDAMYYKGQMLWKCRLDEVQKFGDFIQSHPKIEANEEEIPQAASGAGKG